MFKDKGTHKYCVCCDKEGRSNAMIEFSTTYRCCLSTKKKGRWRILDYIPTKTRVKNKPYFDAIPGTYRFYTGHDLVNYGEYSPSCRLKLTRPKFTYLLGCKALSSLPPTFLRAKSYETGSYTSSKFEVPPESLTTSTLSKVLKLHPRDTKELIEKDTHADQPWVCLYEYESHSVDANSTSRASVRFVDSIFYKGIDNSPKYLMVHLPPKHQYHGRRWSCADTNFHVRRKWDSKHSKKGFMKSKKSVRSWNQKSIIEDSEFSVTDDHF
eukprot:TRINITY_DN4496_c0_g1_i1.p1 TRINITY_DN4496_c0_g1~~TRINITY_DN4496_c0_g1_i1.p1  ORF type:complete len:268 (-),score=7.41 TRINITY_DN4496_c0_g1_i1:400-1203(-)